MPVISPRRTSTTTSGNLYIPPSTTSASGLSSSLGKSITPSSNTSGYSSTYRSSSLSKPASPSYNSSLGYSTGSYLPRTSTYRSSGGAITTAGTSSHGSSSLSGGSSYLSTYRQNSYLSSSNNDSISSRFGQRKSNLENNIRNHDGIKASSLSSSSPSSLARLVATSGLDLYEKYSPAHYIPKCELSRSRSVSEATSMSKNATFATDSSSHNSTTRDNNTNLPLDSGRYNRINSFNNSKSSYIKSDNEYNLSNGNNSIRTRNGLTPLKITNLRVVVDADGNGDDDDDDDDKDYDDVDGSVNGKNSITPRSHLRDLKISSYSAADEEDLANTSYPTVQLDIKIRNASIRSALPPASPTPSRYWDRDREGSSRYAVSRDDYSKSSTSALSNSSADEKSQSEGLCGLRNIGNTCFMNSVIQCLSHTNELTRFLKTQNTIRSTSTKDQQILYEFAKLIREMWTPSTRSVTPMELKRAFSSKHRMYSDYNQQDAQEFLRFFLDSLHSALNSGVKGEQLKIDDSMSDNKKADLTWDWYSKQENSLIRDLFVGQLKSTLKCTTCGNASVTFDPFWDLSVPLPSSSRCKLDACLDFFIREEVLDGDEMPTCSKCKTRRKCTKSFRIQRFPRYLVIHLKRFSETRWSKMSNIVEFPTGERELNMGPYGSNSSTNVYYSLYAISNHMGSTAGGHYVALCKHPVTKKWHEFNDNVVSDDLSESHLVSSSAYILFYERAN